MRDDGPASADTPSADERVQAVADARWPMAAAVVAAIVLTFLMPEEVRVGPNWLLPSVEGVLLIAVIAADPGAISRRSRFLRTSSMVLVLILVVSTFWATGELINDLIHGGPETNSASALLEAGGIVWVSNNIAFALLYWDLDGGGAAARVLEPSRRIDFAFPQEINTELATPGWRPRFIDYLYLGFTNATAFSPTDVMPLTPWAKAAMMVQSLISLSILGLVIARAVNVFS